MSRELHTTFRLTLEALSPLHIGAGKPDLVLDYDYVVEGNRAVVVDLDSVLREADDETLQRAAGDPRLSLLLGPEGAQRYKAYEIDGSSLKGALRTGLAWSAHHGALTLGGLGSHNDPRKADDSLEAGLFEYDSWDTHRDLLRVLRVADAFPSDDITRVALPVSVFSLRGQPPSLQPKGDAIFVEAIPRGTTVETTLTLDRYALRPERRVRGMQHSRKRHFFDQLVDRCRRCSGQLLKLELDFYSDCAVWKLQGFYEALARRQASLQPDEFLLPLGWGTGWLGKTIGTKLTSGEVTTIAETYGLEKWRSPLFPEVFPKTRHLVGNVVPKEPLGWVKVGLESLGIG